MSWFTITFQGAKIKEIRDLTGAQINVSQESLPDSNERTVEVKTLLMILLRDGWPHQNG